MPWHAWGGPLFDSRSRTSRLRLYGYLNIRADGAPGAVVLSVVTLEIGPERGVVMVVDNDAREIYGERYLDAAAGALEASLEERAATVLREIRADASARSSAEWKERIEALLGPEG